MNGPEKLQAAFDRVLERTDVWVEAMKRQQGDDGEVFGMVKQTGADIIAAWIYDGDHPVQLPDTPGEDAEGNEIMVPGIVLEHVNNLVHLQVISPKLYVEREREVRREYAKQAERVA